MDATSYYIKLLRIITIHLYECSCIHITVDIITDAQISVSPTLLAKAATNCMYQQFRLSVSWVAAYFVEEGCNYDP
ncbi:hypothetical protein ALC53_01318 [Atta colombica]|uniref:Uncharacterized protein n=1 Tax=Atta colombica TaxID=520822 RepID=A0A195BVG6_9HYME|nr:hypothetical protein ALC53_01318 [Atta colombica]